MNPAFFIISALEMSDSLRLQHGGDRKDRFIARSATIKKPRGVSSTAANIGNAGAKHGLTARTRRPGYLRNRRLSLSALPTK